MLFSFRTEFSGSDLLEVSAQRWAHFCSLIMGRRYLEPVDGAAVDEGGEAAQAAAEGVPDGAHGQHHVQLAPAALQEHVEERQRAAVRLLVPLALAVQDPHPLADLRLLVHGKQVGHLPRVQQVADVLQEGLQLDLRVGEEEHAVGLALGGLAHDELQVLPPLGGAVALGDLDLEELRLGHVCGQPGEGLPPAAPHPHQQGVAPGLLQHARDAADVLDGEAEQHQVHGLLADVVELLQVGLHHLPQLFQAAHLAVVGVLAFGVVEVAEHEAAQVVLRHLAVPVPVQVLEELVEVLLHVLLGHHLQVAHEPGPVRVVHQPVVVDPLNLYIRAKAQTIF
ncbi:hypothetical protein ANANG_G00277300 [Anguilla anguilla]|uniref:Uncharacterized protein n=1 Tax=Anguilla anguilla TaxID=7936 RepID=A0A9D3LM62_ANGAN|nr:hypothetical protein ANANG_G00277300 [Anguilla anguilla]